MPLPIYDDLAQALREAPQAQLALLGATDRALAYLDEHEETLSDEDLLGLRLLISQAESVLTRYFGM